MVQYLVFLIVHQNLQCSSELFWKKFIFGKPLMSKNKVCLTKEYQHLLCHYPVVNIRKCHLFLCNLMYEKWYFITVLSWIYLTSNEGKHFCICFVYFLFTELSVNFMESKVKLYNVF